MYSDFKDVVSDILSGGVVCDVYYISIGCAANIKDKEENTNMLDRMKDKDNHQYPPFLQDFHMKNPNAKILLILIDSAMEDPPYCIQYINGSIDRYKSYIQIGNIMIANIKQNCCYSDPRDKYDGFNILPYFMLLNEFMIDHHKMIFVHDFTGRLLPTHELDFYINEYGNILRYDLSIGTSLDCYIDLTKPLNFPVIEKICDDIYTIFDPRMIKYQDICYFLKRETNDNKIVQTLSHVGNLIRIFSDKCSVARTCQVNIDNILTNTCIKDLISKQIEKYDVTYKKNMLGCFKKYANGECSKCNFLKELDKIVIDALDIYQIINKSYDIQNIEKDSDIYKFYSGLINTFEIEFEKKTNMKPIKSIY